MSASINAGGGNSASGGFAENWNSVRPMWNRAPIQPGSGITATVKPTPAGPPPMVALANGMGAGGGVGIGTPSDNGRGTILVWIGTGASAFGMTLQLSFAAGTYPAPGGIVYTADWCDASFVIGINPDIISIAWGVGSGGGTLPDYPVPRPDSKPYVIAYERFNAT